MPVVGMNVAAAQFLLTSCLGKEQHTGFWLCLSREQNSVVICQYVSKGAVK